MPMPIAQLEEITKTIKRKFIAPLEALAAQFSLYQQLIEHVIDLDQLPDLVIDPQHDPELEELRTEQKGYKIWKNPRGSEDSIQYMGEIYPPEGRFFLTATDLLDLGFALGRYTVLAPPNAPHSDLFARWQSIEVPG